MLMKYLQGIAVENKNKIIIIIQNTWLLSAFKSNNLVIVLTKYFPAIIKMYDNKIIVAM